MKNLMMSRRGFLASCAAGGGLVVSAPVLGAGQAATAFSPNAYIEITPHGETILTIGKSEMGQGTLTGIAQLVAEELGCTWQTLSIVQADASPDFGFPWNGFMITGGSTGLRSEWMRMRTMGAAAREMLTAAAASRWGVSPGDLTVADGVVAVPGGQHATFAELAGDAARLEVPEKPELRSRKKRHLIGQSIRRVDAQQKIEGKARFGMDVDLPDMLTAVVIAPPQIGAPVISFSADTALSRPGVVDVFAIASGVAVVGEHYWVVHSAREDVEVEWGESPLAGLDMDGIRKGYGAALEKAGRVAETKGNVEAATSGRSVTVEIEQPYLAHACMEPMNFTVWIKQGSAEVWGPTQAQSFVQKAVGRVAGIAPENVTVHTTFLGGGFGRRSAQDFVEATAEIAKQAGGPVKLVYSREDDMRAARLRPFNMTRATGSLDTAGKLASLDIKVATPSISKWSGLLFLIREDGVDEQAVEGLVDLPYDIPNTRITWVDYDPQVPVHFWRSVGASHNSFVVETVMDDLAHLAGTDPLGFRRTHLQEQPRHLTVLERLEEEAGWAVPPSNGTGRGMALVQSFDSIVAEAAEVRIADGELKVEKVTCVIDCGVAVNPRQIEAQMQGSIVYGLSALLRGEITIEHGAVMQSNFHDYEPLRVPEMPEVAVHIIEGADKPGGVGEPGLPPLLPAVANAVFDLTGERVTRLPLVS